MSDTDQGGPVGRPGSHPGDGRGRGPAAANRARGAVEVAVAQLRYDRARTGLMIAGIALAVLSATLLGSLGVGVVETGSEKFAAADRDLWVTGGAIEVTPGEIGGIRNGVVDAHDLAAELERRDGIQTAVPIAFQSVYVANESGEFATYVGTGGPAGPNAVNLRSGSGFTRGDVHYANGTYQRPMTREVVVDPATAERFDVSVNDTLYIGGSIAEARERPFRVVGVSRTYTRFLRSPTVTVPLSELQELTGGTDADRATFVTVALAEGVSADRMRQELEQDYPEYEVRTNREQLRATLRQQAVVIASGVSLTVLAAVAGVALTVNLLFTAVHRQRTEFAALVAVGVGPRTLAGVVSIQAIVLGGLGGLVGVGLTLPAAAALNRLALAIVGFEGLVRTPLSVLAAGFAIAVLTSLVAGLAASIRVARLRPLAHLSR